MGKRSKRQSKKRKEGTAARSRSRENYHIALFCGFLVLLLITGASIMLLAQPTDNSPASLSDWVGRHIARRNYILAKHLLQQEMKVPVQRWSATNTSDDQFIKLGVVGADAWFVTGKVAVPDSSHPGAFVTQPWQVVFRPAADEFIWGSVGDKQFGDEAAAKRAAQMPKENK